MQSLRKSWLAIFFHRNKKKKQNKIHPKINIESQETLNIQNKIKNEKVGGLIIIYLT